MSEHLSSEFKKLVRGLIDELGQQIKLVYGNDAFDDIENIRKEMVKLRGKNFLFTVDKLGVLKTQLKNKELIRQKQIAKAFALMLELINTAENAYRSFRLKNKILEISDEFDNEIIFVFTSHPTEARTVESIPLFKEILKISEERLQLGFTHKKENLSELIRILLRIPIAPTVRPTPMDEIVHTYSFVLDKELLDSILISNPVSKLLKFRAWVGGDKDGHPGVDEKTLMASLTHSRFLILEYVKLKLNEIYGLAKAVKNFPETNYLKLNENLKELKNITPEDDKKLEVYKKELIKFLDLIENSFHFSLMACKQLKNLNIFLPQWVVPLELRESAEIIKQITPSNQEDFV
jgi:phosphoenolpyruvate carboxylase